MNTEEQARPCPICQIPMLKRVSKGITVDSCSRCKGLWLDEGEFDPLVGERFAGQPMEALLSSSTRRPTTCRHCGLTKQQGEHCTRCQSPLALRCPVDGVAMLLVDFESLEFDRCPSCRGIWLDGEETKALAKRSQAKMQGVQRASTPKVPVVTGEPTYAPKLHTQSPALDTQRPAETLALRAQRLDERIVCASCGEEVEKRSSLLHQGERWCEDCFVGRKVPGLKHASLSELQFNAAISYAGAQTRQAERKSDVAAIKKRKELRKARVINRHHVNSMDAAQGVSSLKRAFKGLRSLFRGDQNPED